MRKFSWHLLLTSVFYACAAVGQGVPPTQVSPSNDTGVRPYQTYAGANENIGLANGNLSLQITLASLPGRNGLSLPLSIQYDSKIWSPHVSYSSTGGDVIYDWRSEQRDVGDLGWRFNIPAIHAGNWIADSNGNLIGKTDSIIDLPGGGKASVAYKLSSDMDSEDGSFLRLSRGADPNGPVVVTEKDGTQLQFPSSDGPASQIIDTNGNYISLSGLTDTIGRQISIANTSSTVTTVSYKDSNGTTRNVILTFEYLTLFKDSGSDQYFTGATPFSQPVQTTCHLTNCGYVWVHQPANNAPYKLLTRIDFPDNTAYTFSYNGYGELTKITYPTGGYTKYTYGVFYHAETFWQNYGLNIQADFREVTSKRVCPDSSGTCATEQVTTYAPNLPSVWSPSPVPGVNNDQVDVTNPANERTRYQFMNTTLSDNMPKYHNPRETSRSIYKADGTLLRTVSTAYNSIDPVIGGNKYLPVTVTTTLYDVSPPLVTKTETQYDTYTATVLWPPDQDYLNQSAQNRTRYIDNPTQQTEYDYGQNAPGSPLRITNTTWWKSLWSQHIWNRPLSIEVQDGSATRIALTQLEYDNYTEGIIASGATQHFTGANKGNQTAVSRWRNSDGAMLTIRNQFDDAGNVVKVVDPNLHWTTISFADNWTSGNAACAPASGSAAAYPTLVQNQLSQQAVTTYNSCTGTVATQRDANQQTVTTTYDAVNRPLSVSYPDGGFTQYTYGSATHTTIQKKLLSNVSDPGQWPTTDLYYDGLGRTFQIATKNGETGSGLDVKTTCYDNRGYVSFSSYTTQSSSLPASPCSSVPISMPGDSFDHDVLGRVTQVTHSDSSTILSDYAGRATRVKDEGKDNAGNRLTRVSQVDGLGRLVSVCEKSSANQAGSGNNTPSACGQDIAETGFLTSYQYDIHDAAGTAMKVTQSGLADRYSVYDSLGQLLKATNPESGTTQYTYNDNRTLKTRIRPKPNQQDPNVLLTTTYIYDVLNRLTETHYDDNTPWTYRLYDQSTASGQTLANTVGRLTSVNAMGGQSVNVYNYDPMGRIASNWQCTPAICGNSFKQLAYGYDLLGDVTSASNGFGVTIAYNYNVAARPISVTSSLVDSNHPALLMSSMTYGPFGLTAAAFGNGAGETRGYSTRGLLNSITDNSTVTTLAVPGSGSVTVSGSERTIGGPPATVATGAVTLAGSIQSTQVLNQSAVGGNGTVNLSGTEQSTQAQSSPGTPGQGSATVSGSVLRAYDDNCSCFVYDSGWVTVTVGGYSASANYHQGLTSAYIATSLASNLSGVALTATSSGNTITITSKTNGSNTNYAVSISQSSDRSDLFGSGSFSLSSTNLSGGTNPTYYTLYDTGTVTATVNGFSKSTSYGQGSSAATIASGLASAFNADGSSPVTASASGASLMMASKATGAGTNYSLSGSSATGLGGYFSQPSFTATPTSSTLLGGRDATYSTLYDSGTVSITVNGVAKSTSYDQNSSLAGMASSLATAFNNDTNAPVTASTSGATVNLTSRATGAAANYSLSSSNSTSQGTYFSHASYSGTPSGSALTGGTNTGANVNDAGTVTITVNGFAKSIAYDQNSTASLIASALGSAFNIDGTSPVSASVSGGTVTVTAKTGGAATNYSLSASSATTQSGFTGTSFPASASGANLTGGADSTSTAITAYSVALTFAPNGNVLTANDNVNGNWTYGYDDFNRLTSSSKTGTSYTYAYDRYGNRWQQNGPISPQFSFTGGNNRVDGYCYDAAGNLLKEAGCPVDMSTVTYKYDAENRVISVGSNVAYVYDGDGRRIRKTVSGTSVDFLYDGSSVVAEMSSAGAWNRGEVSGAARHIATYNAGTTFFNHSDWLGSERARTGMSGTITQTCIGLPFGDGQSCSGSETSPNHFTGKERDSESGLDYFGARYYFGNMGRWVSPDWSAAPDRVPYGNFNDPQSLNLYVYLENNPLARRDLDGHQSCDPIVGDTIRCHVKEKTQPKKKKRCDNQCHPEQPSKGRNAIDWRQIAYGSGLFLQDPRVGGWLDVGFFAVGGEIGAGDAGLEEGALEGTLDALSLLGRPSWANTPGGFVSWLKTLQKSNVKLTSAEADAVIAEAKQLGVDVILDPPHGPGNPWNVEHLNIGKEGQVHLEVPENYTNPAVVKRSPRTR